MLGAFVPVDHIGHGIYISGYRATQYTAELRDAKITHVLKLYPDIPYFPSDFVVFDNPIEDGELIPPNKLREGVQFVTNSLAADKHVLIMCAMGVSRSSTFVLASLLKLNYNLEEAYRLLKAQHQAANPHPALWHSLITQYQLPYSLDDVMSWTR